MIEIVYKLRDNPNTIKISEDGAPIDFTSCTRMTMAFDGLDIVADTDVDSSLIDWSQGNGVIEFNINDLSITSDDRLDVLLVAYDQLHPDGQVLTHPSKRELQFKFVSA